jgi:hypothetical protein
MRSNFMNVTSFSLEILELIAINLLKVEINEVDVVAIDNDMFY